MKEIEFNRKLVIQWLSLSLISYVFVCPKLFMESTNIVTNTYSLGTIRFWSNELPYKFPLAGADWFKYSPFFAMIYYPLSQLVPKVHALLWGWINVAVFWLGICSWFSFSKNHSKWIWAALIACAMEVNGSILYQQINALLIGLTLFALAQYRSGRLFWAGFFLAIGANIKILPAFFALVMLVPFRTRYIQGLLLGALFTFLSPAIVIGFKQNLMLHSEWFALLFRDVNSLSILDIASALNFYGYAELGKIIRILILFISLTLTGLITLRKDGIPWAVLIAIGSACLLLVNPRTESPTFVLISPAYLFLTVATLKLKSVYWRRLALLGLWVGIFYITISYNDIWPKMIYNPHPTHNFCKIFGVAGLWTLGIIQLTKVYLDSLSFKFLLQGPVKSSS